MEETRGVARKFGHHKEERVFDKFLGIYVGNQWMLLSKSKEEVCNEIHELSVGNSLAQIMSGEWNFVRRAGVWYVCPNVVN